MVSFVTISLYIHVERRKYSFFRNIWFNHCYHEFHDLSNFASFGLWFAFFC